MNNRLVVFAGSVLAGMLWIGLLTLALWGEPEPGENPRLPALLLDLHGSSPYPLTIQNVMWMVFFIAAGELLHRHLTGRREGEQLAKRLLPEDENTVLRQKDLGEYYRMIRHSDPEEKFWLQRLLKSAILQFQASGSSDQANAIFNANVELYQHEIDLRYNLLRYLVWLIPTLGFIGTVAGIALSLESAGELFAQQADGGEPRPEIMQNMVANLGVAFYTTLLALLQSAVLMAMLHVVQGREEGFLNRCAQYTVRNLLNRLYES